MSTGAKGGSSAIGRLFLLTLVSLGLGIGHTLGHAGTHGTGTHGGEAAEAAPHVHVKQPAIANEAPPVVMTVSSGGCGDCEDTEGVELAVCVGVLGCCALISAAAWWLLLRRAGARSWAAIRQACSPPRAAPRPRGRLGSRRVVYLRI